MGGFLLLSFWHFYSLILIFQATVSDFEYYVFNIDQILMMKFPVTNVLT